MNNQYIDLITKYIKNNLLKITWAPAPINISVRSVNQLNMQMLRLYLRNEVKIFNEDLSSTHLNNNIKENQGKQ